MTDTTIQDTENPSPDTTIQDTENPSAETVIQDTETPAAPAPQAVPVQCSHKSESGRRCKLNEGHDKAKTADGHQYIVKSGISAPKPFGELLKELEGEGKGFTLTAAPIPAGTDLSLRPGEWKELPPRDEHQQRVDKDAERAYEKWVKGGKKSGTFEDLAVRFGGRYVIPPAAWDTVIAMLRMAVQSGGPLQGKHFAYRKTRHDSGNVALNYLFTEKSENVLKPKKK